MTTSTDRDPAALRIVMIADVRGYTQFTVEHGDEEAARLAARFAEVVRRGAEPAGGELVELRGDEAMVSFISARSALRAALDIQRHAAEIAGESGRPIGVGIGLDAGEVVPVLGGYRGLALNLAARLCSLAGVGEVLASEHLTHLAGRLEGVAYSDRGRVRLKGFPEPVAVVSVGAAGQTTARFVSKPRKEPRQLPIGSYLGALPTGQLVAREAERGRLLTAVADVEQGRARAVLLAGEPGAGKTRLAQEVMLEVRNRGFAIGLGACLETREAVPYYPFLDALGAILESTSALLDGWPYLQRLLGGPADSETGSVRAQAELDERVRREFAGFLASVALERPLAILLDDLHWADDSSLQMLQHLVRHLNAQPVLLLGTYRDVEVRREHPLEQVLRELRRSGLVEVVPVRRLAAEGTSALVAASFGAAEISAEFAQLIHQQTDGNPYFVQQVLRTLVERGDVYRLGGGWERRELAQIEVPESIRSAIGERVTRLPDASQEALRAAAVLGARFDFDDLAVLLGLEPGALETALDAATAAGLIRQEGGDGYAFEHAIGQQCLLAELPPRRRRRLHLLAGNAIESRPTASAYAGEIAFHYAEADEPEPAARWWLVAAEDALRLFAYSEAETHLSRAAEAAADAGDRAQEAHALTQLGTVLRLRVKGPQAIVALQRAIEAARGADDPSLEALAVTELANAETNFGEAVSAVARLETLLEEVGAQLDLGTRARALLVLARAHFSSGHVDRMGEVAAEAEAAAREASSIPLIVEAMGRRAHATAQLIGNREAAAIYTAAIELADHSVPPDVMMVLHNNLAYTYFNLGDFDQHLRHRAIAVEFAQRFAAPGQLAFAVAMHAQAEYIRGNLAAARPLADRALALADGLSSWHTGYVSTQRAAISLHEGDFEAAEARSRETFERAALASDLQLASWAVHVLGETLSELGKDEEARQVAAAFVERHPDNTYQGWPLMSLAWAELRCGEAAMAIEHAEAAWRDYESRQDLGDGVEALFVLGAAYSAASRWTDADATFADSLVRASAMPYRWVVGRVHLCQAESFIARGETASAAPPLAAGRAVIEECGFGGLRPTLDRLTGDLEVSSGVH